MCNIYILVLGFLSPVCYSSKSNCLFPSPDIAIDKILFTLYNDKSQNGEILSTDATSMNKNSRTIFIINGFFETLQFDRWPLDMKNAYLKAIPDANVVLIDWSFYSNKNLFTANCNAPAIGSIIGDFIVNLERNGLIHFNNTHLLGFSLGGQVAAFIGQEVKIKTGTLLGKITGLDVVGPAYENKPENERLSADDAEDVIAVHTNTYLIGYKAPVGRIDFYIDGGGMQSSCIFTFFRPTLSLLDNIKKLFCSHYKSTKFQIQSILGKKFVGYQCPSLKFNSCLNNEKVIYGDDVELKYRGIFYVKTDLINE